MQINQLPTKRHPDLSVLLPRKPYLKRTTLPLDVDLLCHCPRCHCPFPPFVTYRHQGLLRLRTIPTTARQHANRNCSWKFLCVINSPSPQSFSPPPIQKTALLNPASRPCALGWYLQSRQAHPKGPWQTRPARGILAIKETGWTATTPRTSIPHPKLVPLTSHDQRTRPRRYKSNLKILLVLSPTGPHMAHPTTTRTAIRSLHKPRLKPMPMTPHPKRMTQANDFNSPAVHPRSNASLP